MSMFTKNSKFFGDDARPIAQVITRRHPLAATVYAMVFLMGMIFVTHFGYGDATDASLFPGVSMWAIIGWKVLMVSGGGLAGLFLLLPPRQAPKWPDLADLLHLEGIAAIVAGFGLTIYLISITSIMGWGISGPSIAFFGTMALGCWWRAWQAISDSQRLEDLAALAEAHLEREGLGDELPD